MSDQKDQKKGQINIELDEQVSEGTYSNLAIINHSVSEFVVDFVNIMPSRHKILGREEPKRYKTQRTRRRQNE